MKPQPKDNEENKAFWDTEEVIAEVPKGEHTKYVISRCSKDGKTYVSVREHYNKTSDPTWRPSPKGMSIPLGIPELAEKIIAAMGKAAY
jgi:hypothetical protein